MAESKTKSRTFRRIRKKLSSNRVVRHFVKKSAGKAICGNCGIVLAGTNNASLKKLTKTQKRPERPYGGVLCSSCSRKLIKSYARSLK